MSTDGQQGEREMVRLALEHINSPPPLHVLVGGLGVGYSLCEVLKDDRVQRVEVVELEEKVIEWNRLYFGDFNADAASDERVIIKCDDVVNYFSATAQKYDLIVLDIDNGPDWLVRQENEKAYRRSGLSKLNSAMLPGGILAVWSLTNNSIFKKRLKKIFYRSRTELLTFEDERGREYSIYLYFGCKGRPADI